MGKWRKELLLQPVCGVCDVVCICVWCVHVCDVRMVCTCVCMVCMECTWCGVYLCVVCMCAWYVYVCTVYMCVVCMCTCVCGVCVRVVGVHVLAPTESPWARHGLGRSPDTAAWVWGHDAIRNDSSQEGSGDVGMKAAWATWDAQDPHEEEPPASEAGATGNQHSPP